MQINRISASFNPPLICQCQNCLLKPKFVSLFFSSILRFSSFLSRAQNSGFLSSQNFHPFSSETKTSSKTQSWVTQSRCRMHQEIKPILEQNSGEKIISAVIQFTNNWYVSIQDSEEIIKWPNKREKKLGDEKNRILQLEIEIATKLQLNRNCQWLILISFYLSGRVIEFFSCGWSLSAVCCGRDENDSGIKRWII